MIAWQSMDAFVYHVQGARAPLQLGDVTGLWPAHVAPNAYVCVEGITEHRGMRQSIARSILQGSEDLWYFRLLGSRGVFVEVAADAAMFGPAQHVQICGRVIDPFADKLYHPLLNAYSTTFRTSLKPPIRLIQHNIEPGKWMRAYLLGGIVWMGVLMWQTWALFRLCRQFWLQTRRPVLHNAQSVSTKDLRNFEI